MFGYFGVNYNTKHWYYSYRIQFITKLSLREIGLQFLASGLGPILLVKHVLDMLIKFYSVIHWIIGCGIIYGDWGSLVFLMEF